LGQKDARNYLSSITYLNNKEIKQVNKIQISTKQTGAFALIEGIIKNGGKHLFGYPGGAILPIYDELFSWEQQKTITHILTRHEQGAIHAADAYARVTGEVGICFATSGPGATNLVTGIANARMDSVPLVVITGQVGRPFIGTDAFQETDIFGITLPIVKHSYIAFTPSDMNEIVAKSFHISQNGRPGPVLIDVPKDVGLEQFYNYVPFQQKAILKTKGHRYKFKTTNKQINKAVHLIAQAYRPLLYVGGGAVISNAHKELLALVKAFSIPVTTTLQGKGIFNENHELSLGMLGMHGTAYANFAISECDLLIAVGSRFDDRVTGKLEEFACHAQVIHIDIDPAEIGKNRTPQLSIVGDVKEILQQILKQAETHPFIYDGVDLWIERINKWRQSYPLIVPQLEQKLSPQQVINNVAKNFPNAIFTTDVGQHQMWSAQFIKCEPRKWATSAGLGTMGYGLPAAIGSQVAFPDSQVVCISGDSSIQMCIQELGTIAQYKLPIRLVIVNNHWQGMVRQWQESFYGERYSHSNMAQGQPNFVKLAESYGIKAIHVISSGYLIEKLEEYKYYERPIVFEILVIEDENCYPMVSPGKSNSKMLGLIKKPFDYSSLFTDVKQKETVTSI
jgi:acetolactate synthase-1/2/3 large subunit